MLVNSTFGDLEENDSRANKLFFKFEVLIDEFGNGATINRRFH